MKTATRLLVSACVGATASAYVLLPISLHQGPRLLRRDTSEQVGLQSGDYAFVANISVGTPAQQISVVVSPSSPDTWVPDATSLYCDPSPEDSDSFVTPISSSPRVSACKWGSFNKSRSSSYAAANVKYSGFSTDDPNGPSATGSNFTDKLAFGGVSFDNYPMGLVDESTQWIGLLGLSSVAFDHPDSDGFGDSGDYVHFIDRLVTQGKISSPAYSVWLDDPAGKSGSLLLGAVDTSKYQGTLTRLPASGSISSYSEAMYGFTIDVVGFNGTADSKTPETSVTGFNDLPFPAIISTATLLSTLPDDTATRIWSMVGATYNSTVQAATIPCSASSGSATFSLQLSGPSGPVLQAHVSDLVLSPDVLPPYSYDSLFPATLPAGTCVFGIQNSSSSYGYLSSIGSSLLRRSYLVFDNFNSEVAVAPVKSNPGTPTIVAFASYGADVPSATLYCGGSGESDTDFCTATSYAYPTSTGYTGSGSGSGSGNGNGNDPGDGSDGSSSGSGMPSWEQAAIGVSVSFGVLAMVALAIGTVLWLRGYSLRKEKLRQMDQESVAGPAPEMTAANNAAAPAAAASAASAAPTTAAPAVPAAANGQSLPAIVEESPAGEPAQTQSQPQTHTATQTQPHAPAPAPAADTVPAPASATEPGPSTQRP